MEKEIEESVARLDEIFPDRPPFQNMVEVIHPEIAKYAEMHLTSTITKIPWENIYTLIKNSSKSSSLYKEVQEAIFLYNKNEFGKEFYLKQEDI